MKKIKKFIKKKYHELRIFYLKRISNSFQFEVQLADHCNLNCVGCSHFSPIADDNFLNIDSYRKDCERLSELAKNHVYEIHLLGGEPLLHKDIVDIIEITRKNFKKSDIKIFTNAILLDRMNSDFWNSCKKNNIIIVLSMYPININIKKICELAFEYQVKISRENSGFTMLFRKDVYDTEGAQNIKKTFKQCKPLCYQFYEGKLYMCRAPAYIKYINKYFSKEFKVSCVDYVDIYQAKNLKTLTKYFRKPIPFCRYCNKSASYNVKWGPTKKEESEWL